MGLRSNWYLLRHLVITAIFCSRASVIEELSLRLPGVASVDPVIVIDTAMVICYMLQEIPAGSSP